MQKISIDVFAALASCAGWQREQDHDIVDRMDRPIYEWDSEIDSLDQIDIPHAWGWASITSTLAGITITYVEGFNYDEYDEESLSTGTDGQDDVWSVDGVTVVDEEGAVLTAHELADYLPPDFSFIDYSALLVIGDEITDINAAESEMPEIILEIDNAPRVRFSGALIGRASSSDDPAMGSSYSGQPGCWSELALYKTGEKFVCHRVSRTRWANDRDRFRGAVCETLDEVTEFFGWSRLAKELYEEAGIDIDDTV